MLFKKFKVIAAVSISICLLASQTAMASTTQSISVPATMQTTTVDQKAEQAGTDTKKEVKTKISLEDAKKIVKTFKFAEGFEFSSAYLENDNGMSQPIWRLDLIGADVNSNISVSISANSGELVNFNSWQGGNNKRHIVSMTRKQAKELADKFIKDYVEVNGKTLELLPEQRMSYEKSNGLYDMPQYDFNYALKINGVLVSDFTYYVSVNASSGQIANYSSPLAYQTETKYPSADGIKDTASLRTKYAELMKMKLQYIYNYDNNNPKVNLIYYPSLPGMLNAKTMDIVKETFYSVDAVNDKPIEADFKLVNKQISDEEADKAAANIKAYIEKLTGITLSDSSTRYIQISSANKEKARNYYYSSVVDNKNYGLQITINTLTGNITNLSYYSYDMVAKVQDKVKEKVTFDSAHKTSNDIIKNLFSRQYGVFTDSSEELQKVLADQKDQPDHQFSYMRFENGISTNDNISVNINKETGKPSQIYINWNDVEYPKPVNLISADKAKEVYLKDVQFELAYYTPYINKNGASVKAEESVIVYRTSNMSAGKLVDAQTGTVVDYSGKAYQQKSVNESHWAAVNIEMLEAQGVVLNNISNYDDKLTRQDAVKMMSIIMGVQYFNAEKVKGSYPDVTSDNEYFRYVESAVLNSIIEPSGKNFDGKQLITKQEFITMLFNVLGYQDLLKHPELFAKTDKDLKTEIFKALDILPVKPGEAFNVNDNITYAEASYSLQKALKYIR